MKARNVKLAAMTAALVGVIGVGGIMAYLTDTDSKVNKFTLGKVDITETEPEWDKDPDPEGVTPNQKITKDPTVKNEGDVDAFVFQIVKIPVANVVTANEDGTRNPAADQELFKYSIDSTWAEVGHRDVMDGGKVIAREYLYAYGSDAEMTPLTPGSSTHALFSEVQYINVIEGSTDNAGNPLEESVQQINVQAFGIQTSDLNGGKTAPADVWSVYANQNSITDVYSK